MVVVCAGCQKPILDRFLMNVLDQAWHPDCVTCSDCQAPLTEKCFSKDGKLYCKNDFFRQFGTKCAGCKNGISPNELVRKARERVFHLKCFMCVVCRKQLSTGEELYVLNEHKFLCKADYINNSYKEGYTSDTEEIEDSVFENDTAEAISDPGDSSDKEPSFDGDLMMSPHTEENSKDGSLSHPDSVMLQTDINNTINDNNNSGHSSDKDENNSVGDDANGNKRRGPRTTIKAKQLETLKAAFAATPKPTRHIREQLAAETGLNMRVIQVWFQNRRSKERRLKQMNSMGARRGGPFFGRSPRRMRGSHLDVESPEMPPPYGFPYPADNQADGYYNNVYQNYPQEFYPNNQAGGHEGFMATPNGNHMDITPVPHQGMHDAGAFIPDIMSQTSPDRGMMTPMTDNGYVRSTSYNPMSHHPPPIESW